MHPKRVHRLRMWPRLLNKLAHALLLVPLVTILTLALVWVHSSVDPAQHRSVSSGPPRVILFWNKFYNNEDFYVGFGRKPFAGCQQDNCITTSNRSRLVEADAVLFHMLNEFKPLPTPAHSKQRLVFFLQEPPTLSAIRDPALYGVFNMTMTYRQDSDVINGYFSVQPGAEPTPLPAVDRRTRPVAWIVSHCETVSGRELYVEQLQDFITVDVFGACGSLSCPTAAHGGARHECHRALAPHYFFYLAFENSQCRDYVTEKLSLALRYGMVPVVLGTTRTEYEHLAPPGSFIHTDDFAGPRQLAAHLQYLMTNSTAYSAYHAWRRRYRVAEPAGWCDLCRYLHEPHEPRRYLDISRWWIDEAHCSLETVVPEEPVDDDAA